MRVYLDWNATTPPCPDVLARMRVAEEQAWGNPASIHGVGQTARREVERARAEVAELVGRDARDVVLTSGGTEANNLALRSAFSEANGVLVTSRLEHPSITRVAEALASEGRAEVEFVPVLPGGTVDVGWLDSFMKGHPVTLVAMSWVNHETGIVQPVRDVHALCRAHGVRLHVDAVQAFGKVSVDPTRSDTLSVAAHKMRGPKGIGALATRLGLPLSPVLLGGSQERGIRPGTVDARLAVGLGAACARANVASYERLSRLRDRLEEVVLELGGRVHGEGERAPHVTNVSFHGWDGPTLVAALDLEGVCVSSGSACSAGTSEPSAAIEAMLGKELAGRAVRFSLGDATTEEEIEYAAGALRKVVPRGAR